MNKILLYDGVCGVCNGFVNFIVRFDKGTFRFFPLQKLPINCVYQKNLGTLIYCREKAILKKSSAVLAILQDLGFPFSLLAVLKLIPKPVRDFAYDLLAKYRYKIAHKLDSCEITEHFQNLKAKFLRQKLEYFDISPYFDADRD